MPDGANPLACAFRVRVSCEFQTLKYGARSRRRTSPALSLNLTPLPIAGLYGRAQTMNADLDDFNDSPMMKFLRRAIIAGVIAAILVAASFVAPPAYRQFKGWRAKRLAVQAEQLINQNEWPQATEKAQGAFLLSPTEPTALRAMARVLTHATNVTALQFWQQLRNTGQATVADRRAFAEFALRTGARELATVELQRLLAEGPNDPVNLWLASQLHLALGDYRQTVNYATRAQRHDPTNQQYQLFHSSLRFDAPEPDPQVEARRRVWNLARTPGEIGFAAQRFLGQREDLTPAQRQELITLWQQQSPYGISQQLLVAEQQLRLTPQGRAEILAPIVSQCQTSTVWVDRNQLAIWLNQNEEFQRTLVALPLADALQRKELFLPHVDALASLGRWAELEKILDTNPTPLEQVFLEGFQARCAMQLNKETSATMHWNRALRAAERNPAQLVWLAAYAEKCRAWEYAKKAARFLLAYTADVRPTYQALQRLTQQSGTTTELRDLIGEMHRRWPQDPALRNDFAYLNLLLATNLPASRQTAQELVNQFPENLPYRTTLALACYRLKDHPAALGVYDGRQYDWRQSLPGNRAVYAAVLAANGNSPEARRQAQSLPRERLRPEEFELIRSSD